MLPAFLLYLLFVVSWFLRLTVRVPVLATIRLDLVLVVAITVFVLLSPRPSRPSPMHPITSRLLILILFIIVTIPFVEWPGSVVKNGTESFLKAVIFYYFTVKLLNTEKRLGAFLTVFVSTQLFRILEPLYLHLTEGYWGDAAFMRDAETLERLAGSPYDIINPNGLAFVILTVIPFLYFLWRLSMRFKILAAILTPIAVYALVLTGSRSGMVGLFAIAVTICLQSRRRLLAVMLFLGVTLLALPYLSPNHWDRFISLVDSQARNAATAEGRITGVLDDLEVAMNRPFFGHGLGTSREANGHFRGVYQLSHNLYTEVAQELGFIGLAIFLSFMLSVIRSFSKTRVNMEVYGVDDRRLYLLLITIQIWLYTSIVFSLASYGLSSYLWYLLAGLCAVFQRLAEKHQMKIRQPMSSPDTGHRACVERLVAASEEVSERVNKNETLLDRM